MSARGRRVRVHSVLQAVENRLGAFYEGRAARVKAMVAILTICGDNPECGLDARSRLEEDHVDFLKCHMSESP